MKKDGEKQNNMSGKIIRCLFGSPGEKCYWSTRDVEQTVRLKKEIVNSLSTDWAKEDVLHYAMGQSNYDLLKESGAQNVVLVDDKETLVPNEGVSPLYNKVYLINEAMKDHDEVLFLDFDALPVKSRKPDDNMWKLLRDKGGRFNGSFQAPFVKRSNPFCLSKGQGGYRDPSKVFTRKVITTCMLYCNDRTWIQEWLDHFLLYQEVMNKHGQKVLNKHDEYVFMYYIDKVKGVMNEEEIVDSFEPQIGHVRRCYVNPSEKDVYFSHA